ncbi:hypothetical protein GCM10011371_22540 [Novosphingobium marinum]|uniref:Uncharacterized protein n=1 Tax=Novosphingobium marinum TaxID=1514948 RepID=A0A7Y9XZV3_9SPHN|nr:hypothetical protein [Novosphingobium marinum]NYH96368.1 hypothetical protein [Novosphingobium marinum]GGC34686.1 hypothetical protein GCM10011371_22540 [Novosphingobium marinum]
MGEASSFASLSPGLLARKGAARPAMRRRVQPLNQFHQSAAFDMGEDLGWNDMGFADETYENEHEDPVRESSADVVNIDGSVQDEPQAEPPEEKPVVRQQQESVAASLLKHLRPRRSAFSLGRRAAFTLRMDEDRHLRLRLACTVTNRSAQQLVTEALDRFLRELPEVDELAAKVAKPK